MQKFIERLWALGSGKKKPSSEIAVSRHHYAQTNIQLYNQLQNLECSAKELGAVRDAYDLATLLFAGAFRGNGKPFLSHLVGTASILAVHGAPLAAVVAGLLHAAYFFGRFGDRPLGISEPKRQQVRSTVGQEVEELIAGYTAFSLDAATTAKLEENLHALSPGEECVVLIYMANALEDRLDLGRLYCAKSNDSLEAELPLLVKIAKDLGVPRLGAELAEACRRTVASSVPPVLRRSDDRSYVLAPSTSETDSAGNGQPGNLRRG